MPRIKKIYDEKKKKSLNHKQILILYQYLLNQKDLYFDKFFEIIKNEKIKIFVIDFFITTYCNKNNLIINKDDKYIDVYNDYKTQLKSYNKKYFDPYKRNEKFELCYNNEKIITTVGQMNFFKWLITNKIIDYIEKEYDTIYKNFKEFKKQ